MTSQSTVDPIGKRVSVALALIMLAILGAVFLHHKRVIAAKQAAATLAANARIESELFKYDPDHDRLHQESVKLAGPDAVDCGRVPVHGDPKAASNCALRAQKKRKPFRVRFDLMGTDSFVAVALVRTPVGTVSALQYDSMGGMIYPSRCPEPVHLWLNSRGRITCFQDENSAPFLSAP